MRILVLMHGALIPPQNGRVPKIDSDCRTEYDVIKALKKLKHILRVVGLVDRLEPLEQAIAEFKPQVVFNLMEEFMGRGEFDQHLVSYLEMKQIPYTGCNPRGLTLARDKMLSKHIANCIGVPSPKGLSLDSLSSNEKPIPKFPLVVKSRCEDASLGLSQTNVVYNRGQMAKACLQIRKTSEGPIMAEEYIDGREIYVSLIEANKNRRTLTLLPLWEMFFRRSRNKIHPIASREVKWSQAYRKKYGITTGPAAPMPAAVKRKILASAKSLFFELGLSGYARLDFRLAKDHSFYFLEANPNPNIGRREDFARAAAKHGFRYEDLLQKIIRLSF